ncbi:MAG: ligand-gated channel protein [Rhodospirillales bacterium 20-60-12]|nr:MAG: ligand-gated channel protein [Rhodospirillales bacterium 20-60-12]HQT66858.1 TonB-dependent receptor [Acetobacteraceae bacterium]
MNRIIMAALIVPILGQYAHADGTIAPPIGQTIVTATQIPTLLPDVPAGVTVITRAEIDRRGYTTLTQALGAVPGLGIVQSGGPGGVSSVFIRGTNSEDVLVLLDGVPVNDPSIANGAFNFGEDDLADIERIEIVRGPMSGLYGSGAIGGVINLITRQGSDKPRVDVSLAGGFPAQGQGSVTLSGQSGKFDYALTGSVDEQAGFDQVARRISAYNGQRDPYRNRLASVNLGYTPFAGTRLSLLIRARKTDAAFPDLGYPIYDDPNEYGYDSNLFARAGIASTLFSGRLTTELFAARVQDDRLYTNLLDAADPNQTSENGRYHGYRTDIQWNNTLHLPDAGPAQFSALLFGVEHIDDRAKQLLDLVSFGSLYLSTLDASQSETAGHIGLQSTLFDHLTLTGALRDDHVSSFGSALTYRIGAVLAVPAIDAHLKAAYGTGFHAPSLYDLYGIDNFGYVGNPALRAERSTGYEAGARFDLPAFGRPDLLSLSATYFDNDIKDLITYTTLPTFASTEENIAQAKIHGVESELVLSPADWLHADITYTYTIARDAATRAALLRRPQNAGSLDLRVNPIPAFTIEPEIKFIGRFSDYLYGNDGYPTNIGYAKSGTIVDLTATYQISPRLSLFATGDNLLESRFEPVNGLQTPGQSFLFGVRGHFGLE